MAPDPASLETLIAKWRERCSWWICPTDSAFTERHQRELPRITGSAMAKTLRPILLGGRLP